MPVDHKRIILDKIRKGERLSIFWATTTQRRAAAMESLEKSGAIVRQKDHPHDQYPWMVYIIADPPGAETVKAARFLAPPA